MAVSHLRSSAFICFAFDRTARLIMVTEHYSKQYDTELEALRSRVLQMGGLVESQIRKAVEAFATGRQELIDEVVAAEALVNSAERDIDDDCSHIVVKRQPAAVDLRLIMAISKTVTDLERIGDEAEKIARMSRQIHDAAPRLQVHSFANVRHAADIALTMLHRALDAFARLDAAMAAAVIRDDVAIDNEFRSILRQLITFMMEDPRTISMALEIVWIAKAVERIGDHAKNVAEDVIYIVKGTDVRHIRLEELERQALGG
jgi:phosphate transport system protein